MDGVMQVAGAMLQQGERREWLGLLARAPLALLEAWASRQPARRFAWLRRPETGLVMVRARAGGTGAQFNLGEMTVTRCALRLEGAAAGVAYVQGRSARTAEIAALADALLQGGEAEAVRRELIEPLREQLAAERARRQREAQSTRVEFFTLARETEG
jgi:alpha-D-ribose 1-methylphosphonate 5-triphosphate synthase subunit PhnG